MRNEMVRLDDAEVEMARYALGTAECYRRALKRANLAPMVMQLVAERVDEEMQAFARGDWKLEPRQVDDMVAHIRRLRP